MGEPTTAIPEAEAARIGRSEIATKADLADLKNGVTELHARTAVLETRFTDLKDGVDALRKEVADRGCR